MVTLTDEQLEELREYMIRGNTVHEAIKKIGWLKGAGTNGNGLIKQFIRKFGKNELQRVRQEHIMPKLREQRKNLFGAGKRAIEHMAKGRSPLAEASLVKERRAICDVCDKRIISPQNENMLRCSECGCHVGPKVRMETEKCPIDKW